MSEVPCSQVLCDGRNRVCRVEYCGHSFVVKQFFNKGLWKKMVYRIASSKARRSFDNSMSLMRNGLNTPHPVAWREDWNRLFLKESYYICAHLEVAQTARSIGRDEAILWRPQVRKIAQSIALMHEAGMLHLDLTPGNILFSGDRPEDWKVYFIDNNRMKFGKVSMRRGIQSLVQAKIEGYCQASYVAAYAEARGFDPDACQKLYTKLMKRHNLKWRLKNWTRPWRRKIGL